MEYEIEYGNLKVKYRTEGDLEGNNVFITSIVGSNIELDAEDMADIKFHCMEDYGNRQSEAYIKRGELI